MSRFFVILLVPLFLIACSKAAGPELADVSGVITLDGEPLANAGIMFQPEFGRPAFATTDSQGGYSLRYSEGSKGGAIGTNYVYIRTEIGSEDGGPPVVKEKLPVRYHEKTELTANITSGKNTINFELFSK